MFGLFVMEGGIDNVTSFIRHLDEWRISFLNQIKSIIQKKVTGRPKKKKELLGLSATGTGI